MKIQFFHLIPAVGVLALSAAAFAADPAVPHDAASAPASASTITLNFRDAARVTQNGHGGLDVIAPDGGITHYQPQLYQVINGKRKLVHYRSHVIDGHRVELKAVNSDASAPLEVAPLRTNS